MTNFKIAGSYPNQKFSSVTNFKRLDSFVLTIRQQKYNICNFLNHFKPPTWEKQL